MKEEYYSLHFSLECFMMVVKKLGSGVTGDKCG